MKAKLLIFTCRIIGLTSFNKTNLTFPCLKLIKNAWINKYVICGKQYFAVWTRIGQGNVKLVLLKEVKPIILQVKISCFVNAGSLSVMFNLKTRKIKKIFRNCHTHCKKLLIKVTGFLMKRSAKKHSNNHQFCFHF
jgi:hypothetical protein